MQKENYVKIITNEISTLDFNKLDLIYEYVKNIKYKVLIDPTLEIVTNEKWGDLIKVGINEIENNQIVDWESYR